MNPNQLNQPLNSYQGNGNYSNGADKDILYELAKKVSVGGVLVIVIIISIYFTFQISLKLITPPAQLANQQVVQPVVQKDQVIDDLEGKRPEVSDETRVSILKLVKPSSNVSKAQKDEIMNLLASE